MAVSYDHRLVVLSVVIAVMASYTALYLADRVGATCGRVRLVWLAGGAVAMGIGIWSMHFIAMLAFSLLMAHGVAMAMSYDVPLVLVSLLDAIAASALALCAIGARGMGRAALLAGGALMGLAIASMHYIGMAAMRMQADVQYQPALVSLSVLVAVGAATAALWLGVSLRRSSHAAHRRRAGAAVIMGGAIVGMHHTAMAAATFVMRGQGVPASGDTVRISLLGAVAIGGGTVIILVVALATVLVDLRLKAQEAEARALRANEERLRHLGEQLQVLLQREQAAHAQAEAERQRFALLAEVSSLLASSLDYAATLSSVARVTVPALADWCVVDLMQDQGTVHRLAVAHTDPAHEALLHELERYNPLHSGECHPIVTVLRSGRPILHTEVPTGVFDGAAQGAHHCRVLRALDPQSLIIVPLIARGRILGAISLVSSVSGRRYRPADLELAEELARRAALAIDNARLHQQVQDALRVRDDFLTAASHDLRTPLTAIKGRADLLQIRLDSDKPLDEEWVRAQVAPLRGGVARMMATVNEISDVAQLQMGGRVELVLKPVDVATLVRAAVGIVADAGGRDAAPVFVKAPEGIVVEADQPRLERVLQNIIGNAVKYSPQATPVCVDVEACEQWITIKVRDQGVGIPSDELPHIFRRFYRASTSTGVAGTGIGLAGSKTIVEQHGGTIAVESAAGHGTTVTISLPRLAPEHRTARSSYEGMSCLPA